MCSQDSSQNDILCSSALTLESHGSFILKSWSLPLIGFGIVSLHCLHYQVVRSNFLKHKDHYILNQSSLIHFLWPLSNPFISFRFYIFGQRVLIVCDEVHQLVFWFPFIYRLCFFLNLKPLILKLKTHELLQLFFQSFAAHHLIHF